MLRVEARSDFDPLTTVRAFGDREQRLDNDKNIKDVKVVRMVGCNIFESV